MDYLNPKIPEGINTSKTHPLIDFAWLLVLVGLVGAALLLFAGTLGELIAGHISIERENEWAQSIAEIWIEDSKPTKNRAAVEQELQQLADRLVQHMDVPDHLSIKVHYIDNEVVNAMTTLGGHVFFFRGLLQRLPHENALAMVMAHEIAHATQRHPMRMLGRGLGMSMILVVSGMDNSSPTDLVLNSASHLGALSFSRDNERVADRLALSAVNREYGHVGGATDLFKVLLAAEQEMDADWQPEFARTHPSGEHRIEDLESLARELGYQVAGDLTAMPKELVACCVQPK